MMVLAERLLLCLSSLNNGRKYQGLFPADLNLSLHRTHEAIQIVKSNCRSLVKARINECHRRLNYNNNLTNFNNCYRLTYLTLINVKDRDEPSNRQGAVYKIKCSDCQASYIGESGRNLTRD